MENSFNQKGPGQKPGRPRPDGDRKTQIPVRRGKPVDTDRPRKDT